MNHPFVSRLVRRLSFFVGAGLVGMLAFSLFGHPPLLSSSAQAAARTEPGNDYDLASMEVLKKVVANVKDNYVDPKRIDAKEMFVAALEGIEKSTAEVMVEGTAKDGHVRVTAGGQTRDFPFGDLDGAWRIPQRLRPVFEFIQANVSADEKRLEIEYAAINGMLSTLDPHSVLLRPPEYREMKLTTTGEFGGLGFVIALEEERLTVKKVLKNTPAAKGGLKRGDHIAQIDDESTINMDLSDAVSKMRGKPGTEVRLVVRRDKEAPKTYRLTRDLISVESVTSQLLGGGVGYVRLSSFAGTTARDLSHAVREMRQQAGGKLKGLVLDLRSNPGGLLDQAQQVADQFVDKGAIVTTVGMNDKLRDAKEAHAEPGDKEFPVVVLVNAHSASASEIVSGALRNLDRAVIVGRQTFGKGSVQVLNQIEEPGTKNEAALKLTIAQYLTPGDRSIQETGVTPDIELVPALISRERVDLFAPPRLVREADLENHFGNGFQTPELAAKAVAAVERPGESLRYLRTAAADPRKQGTGNDGDDAADEPDEDAVSSDPQVEFARELLLNAPRTDRPGMMQAAKGFLAERREREDAKIQQSIEALGLDWSQSKARPVGTPQAKVDFHVTPAHPVAGQKATLEVVVTNTGGAPYERLRGFTQCDAEKTRFRDSCAVFDRQEFLFGRVAPGETRRWSTEVKVPAALPTVRESFSLVFQDAQGLAPAPQHVDVETLEVARPVFAFSYEVQDKDGVAVPGETVDVRVDVRNTGTGAATSAFVSVKNEKSEKSEKSDKVFIKKGRIALGSLAPGEVKSAVLTLELRPGLDVSGGIPLRLDVADNDVWELARDVIALPTAEKPPSFVEKSGAVRLREDVRLLAAPQATAPELFEGREGSVLPVKAKSGEWLKVEAAKGRTGWVRASRTVAESKTGPAPSLAAVWREAPKLAFAGLDTGRAAVVTDQDHLVLGGSADDASGVMDVRIFVDNEKVFFHTSKSGKQGREKHVGFEADLPLKPGNNHVLIVAREDGEFATQRTIVVHRSGAAVAGQQAPPATPAR